MGWTPCCEKAGLKKGPWSEEEDKKLVAYVQQHGRGNWSSFPAKAGLQRCGKSCRLRWINYLKPDIKRGNFSLEEDRTIIQLHALLGNKWSIIAGHLHNRTDNEIKNYWHSHLKKRITKMGIDPITHKPKANDQSKDAAIMSHMAQWESTRLEAEARESMLQVRMGSSSSFSNPTKLIISKIPPQPSPPPCLDVLKAWQNSHNSSETLIQSSTKHNKNTMYNMYAIMLSTNNELESPQSTWTFPELMKLPVSSTISNEGDRNIIETFSSKKIMEDNVSSLQNNDDDIMVAVEAFREARFENIPVLSNGEVQGLNIDMQTSISYERFEEEYGYGNCNFDTNLSDWNSLLYLDNDSPSDSP